MIFSISISVDKILGCVIWIRTRFCLAMSGDSLDEIVRPEMRQAYETDKTNWQINLVRELPVYLSMSL